MPFPFYSSVTHKPKAKHSSYHCKILLSAISLMTVCKNITKLGLFSNFSVYLLNLLPLGFPCFWIFRMDTYWRKGLRFRKISPLVRIFTEVEIQTFINFFIFYYLSLPTFYYYPLGSVHLCLLSPFSLRNSNVSSSI